MSEKEEKKGFAAWIDKRLPVFTFINHNLRDYPTPKKSQLFLEFRFTRGDNPSYNDCYWDITCNAIHS